MKWSLFPDSLRSVRGRFAVVVAIGATLTAAVTLSFAVTQYFNTANVAQADPANDLWYWALLEAEEQKPRPDGVIAGIQVGPNVDIPIAACQAADAAVAAFEDATASVLDVRPTYLPAGTEMSAIAPMAARCGETLVWAEQEWFVPPDPESGRYGGYLIVYRSRDRGVVLDYAADRLGRTNIGGRPAVVIQPLTEDGFGNSSIVINEPFGVTIIHASGITGSDLLLVAESLRSE